MTFVDAKIYDSFLRDENFGILCLNSINHKFNLNCVSNATVLCAMGIYMEPLSYSGTTQAIPRGTLKT